MKRSSCKSLDETCVDKIVDNIEKVDPKNLVYIPQRLRDKLLEKFMQKSLLTDELLGWLVSEGTSDLSLFCCHEAVGDSSLKIITEKCPNLKQIALFRCSGFSKEGLGYFFRKMKKLERVRIEK